MTLPNDFINTIADAFYDKTITLFTHTRETDAEGFVVRDITESETTVMANVIDNQSKLQEEYGIAERFDLAFTCKPDEVLETDGIVGYNSKTYKIQDIKKSDSHKLVIAKLWSSKSSILPSA